MQKVEIKLIDMKVARAQQNKMAGSSGESDNILIQNLKENAVNKNTLQSTNNWVKVWKSWASQKGYDESIEKYEPGAKILEQFYATVRKKNAIDRYLADKEYKHSIIRDRELKSSKQVLEGKVRLLRQQGKGTAAEQGHKINLYLILLFFLHCLHRIYIALVEVRYKNKIKIKIRN